MKRFVKLLTALLLLSALVLPKSNASAALRICRTDPLIYLSNGHKLSVTASVATNSSDIREIVYRVRVPVNAQVTQIIHTAGGLGIKESVFVIADQPEGNYIVDTIVYTGTAYVKVTATTMLMLGVSSSASGYSGRHLITTVSDPGTTPRSTR